VGPIQTIPKGLLSLLNLKQMGQNPGNLLGDVYPTLDLRDQYMQYLAVNQTALIGGVATMNLATASPGIRNFTTGNPVVPNGQTWYVFDYTVFGSLLPAETLSLVPIFQEPGTGGGEYAVGPPSVDVITARARGFCTKADKPFWLAPGTNLAIHVLDDLTAATITINACYRAVPLLV